jgi:hypothetical protein
MRWPLPFHSYRLKSLPASSTRLINCYAEPVPDGKGPLLLRRAPGVRSWWTPTPGTGRGVHNMAGTLYAVVGQSLYSIRSNGVATNLGTVKGSKVCWMTDNGTQLVVGTDSGTWYVYNRTTEALSQIIDSDFTSRGARSAWFADNYITFTEPNSGRWFISDIAAADVYDALDFATAEGHPDNLITHAVDHREVILIGEQTSEIYYNSGASGMPYERSPNGFIELGGAANQGITKADNSVFWLANDRTVRRLAAQTPQKVSHFGVDEIIRGFSDISTCYAFSYTFNGHIMAVFKFTDACFVYDVTTGEWHERESYGYDTWNVSGAVEAYGQVYVQNSLTGAVGYFDSDVYTEWGGIQRASWTYQPVYKDHDQVGHSSLEVVCETGVGLVTGQGSDPRLTLEISNDGGRTWHTMPTRSLGAQGKYKVRAIWHALGQSRDRVYRMSISDPVALTVFDTQLEAA